MPVNISDIQKLTKKEDLEYIEASEENFSGKARFARLPEIENSDVSIAVVEFDKGTVTNWHTHSQGQYLIITEGEGRTQEWGKEIQTVKKGDVIWCPPKIKHWHGAAENLSMKHIAVAPNSRNNRTNWFERPELPQINKEIYLKNELEKHKQTTSLTQKQLIIPVIAALTVTGDVDKLKKSLNKGLDNGLTVNEIKEIFSHQHAYIGFPKALTGLLIFYEVLKERIDRGIKDTEGESPIEKELDDYYSMGEEVLNILTQRENSGILNNFDGMDTPLKAQLFGYLFSRENLSYVDRELTAMSTIAAQNGVEKQLRSHLAISRNLGLNDEKLDRIVDILNNEVDKNIGGKIKENWGKIITSGEKR